MDNLSLNGAGGITRRMTDKERIAELERQLSETRTCLDNTIAIENDLHKQLAESVPISKIKDLEPEYIKVIDENFWDLI